MLTDLQKKKLTRYFRVYDVDDDGRIGPADFDRVLENVRALHRADMNSSAHRALQGGYLSRWEALRTAADANQDGSVDLQEWLAHWDGVLTDEARYKEAVASVSQLLFEVFDTDEDGVLGADEFCNFYGIYGLKSAEARRVFLDLDLDGDGQVTLEELLAMVNEFYRSDDPDAPGNGLFGPLG
ncbi:MAG: hypothetical protein AMXMBFR53_00140 [Gemmatimonadota bacterium]